MEKNEKPIKASDIEDYGVNNYHFNNEYIYLKGDYDGGEEIIMGIIDFCRSDKDIDEIKKRLYYGIIGSFISTHNTFLGAKEALDKYMKDEFEEASREVWDGGNYGWDMCFSQLLYNLKIELEKEK
jgi:hypothetical protein